VKGFDCWNAVSNVVAMTSSIAAVVIACLTYVQTKQNREQLQEMIRTRKASTDPFITVSESTICAEPRPTRVFEEPPFLEGFESPFEVRVSSCDRSSKMTLVELMLANKGVGNAYNVWVSCGGKRQRIEDVMEPKEIRNLTVRVCHDSPIRPGEFHLTVTYASIADEHFQHGVTIVVGKGESGRLEILRILPDGSGKSA
jgi:hypothetical protein